MFTMFDTVDPTQIPKNANAVAGYVGGVWPTDSHDALRAKFPHAYVLSIATNSNQKASCLDIENGDADISQLRPWMEARMSEGQIRPCVFGSWTTMDEVPGVMRGIARWRYRKWISDPTGVPHVPNDFGACQWGWNYLGRDLDVSLCQPWFFTQAEHPLGAGA